MLETIFHMKNFQLWHQHWPVSGQHYPVKQGSPTLGPLGIHHKWRSPEFCLLLTAPSPQHPERLPWNWSLVPKGLETAAVKNSFIHHSIHLSHLSLSVLPHKLPSLVVWYLILFSNILCSASLNLIRWSPVRLSPVFFGQGPTNYLRVSFFSDTRKIMGSSCIFSAMAL